MRTELWGLRDKETQELVLTYWASSQKHKALFSTRGKAEDACKYNPQYEPFRIEAEPVKHGCEYCQGEKKLYQQTYATKLYVNTFGKARTLEVECVPCPPYANCVMKEVPARTAFIIKYCPECGRRLDGGDAE